MHTRLIYSHKYCYYPFPSSTLLPMVSGRFVADGVIKCKQVSFVTLTPSLPWRYLWPVYVFNVLGTELTSRGFHYLP